MTISNRDDVIDSRNVIERIEELDEDGSDELAALVALAEECEKLSPDWKHGEALVRESHFVDYAKSLADDLGYVTGQEAWPLNCIDWEKAAAELRQDYSQVDYAGVAYWIHNG